MTVAKIRVKDLAAELEIGNKELLQALRDLGVHAKSHMSVLTEEDADNLRAKFKGSGPVHEVVRKEVQPGVIVRRRKQVRSKRAKAGEPEEEPVAAEAEDAVEDEAVEAAIDTAHDAEPETAEPEAARDETPETPEFADEPRAKIVTPAVEAEAEAAEEPEEEAAEAPEAEVQEPAAPAAEEAAPQEPEAGDATEADEAKAAEGAEDAAEDEDGDKPKKKKAKKKKKDEGEGPQVKIIAMPDPNAAPPARPARPARPAGRPGRPAGGRPAPGAPRPGFTPPDRAAIEAAANRKTRKKDKRVVEFHPDLSDEERRRKASLQAKKGRGGTRFDDRSGGRGRGRRKRSQDYDSEPQQQTTQPVKAAKRKIRIDEAIRVSDFAHQMGVKAPAVIKVLMQLGVMSTINQSLDIDTAGVVAAEFGYEVERIGFSEDEFLIPKEEDSTESLKQRPPVVTIMGHVDHGKTSLLDAIRKADKDITAGEAGGITQHIGAYHVTTERGDIVFLDTPGHEAFTAMRARGAQVTDLVILVVAADDGVMDQTREAVSHSKAAGVPILVAVNKIDKEDANPDRVKRELGDLGLIPEDWGGETIFAHVSAKQHTGLDELLEMVALQAEVLELKANPDKPARGHIVEAKLDKGRGAVGTVLVQEGTLRQGDPFVCGVYSGRVRAMFDDHGNKVTEAGPSIPVEVQGFDGVPEAGDEFVCVADDKNARRIAEQRQLKQRERDLAKDTKVTLETFLASSPNEDVQTLNLIVKSDVAGSFEAIGDALKKQSTEKVKVEVIHGGAGAITESDILLASASQAIIIGFNVRPTIKVKDLAEQEGVDIRFYDIIYKLVSEVKDAMAGLLAPLVKEVYQGQAEVIETFSVPKVGVIAGCKVADGKVTRNAGVRLLRDGLVIYTGTVTSLKRFKDDVKEVAKGYECGIGLENFNDIKIGDFIEFFEEVEVAQTL